MKINVGRDLYLHGRIGWKGLNISEYLSNGNYRIINATALMDGFVDWNNCGFITKERYEESPEIMLKENDILISKDGTLGKIGYVKNMISECTVAAGIFVLRNTIPDQLDFDYLYHLLKSNVFKNFIRNYKASGSTINHLYQVDLEHFEVDVPSISSQRKIADVLSALDDKIALNHRINAKLEQMAKRLYDYWFVQFDFPNAEGKPYKSSGGKMVYNATLKREIPEGWEVKPLDSFISAFNSGDWGADEPSDSQSLEVRCIRGADINTLANLPKRFIKNTNTYKLLSNWNLVIEKSGGSPTQSTARSAFITPGVLERNGGNVVCSNFCEAFSFVDFQASAFFYYTWKMFYDNGIMFNYEGKTSGIRNFMTDTFLANLWIVPPQNLIESFFAKAKTIHAKIDANISESIKLTALRDKLLPLLMNGQVTVK